MNYVNARFFYDVAYRLARLVVGRPNRVKCLKMLKSNTDIFRGKSYMSDFFICMTIGGDV